MSLWRRLTRGLHVLAHRRAADRDIADEVQHYLDQATAALVAGGLSPEEAARVARIELGSAAAVREQVRAHGWESGVDTLVTDLRYAARRLRADPGFAAVSVLTLALGIGASTAIFSAVNPILFEPLPYPRADRIVTIREMRGDGVPGNGNAFGTYRWLVERSRSLERVAAMKPWQPTLTGATRPTRLDGQRVSAAYFQVLGVPPALGRGFQAADDTPNGPRLVLLSHRLWQGAFGGDSSLVGRAIRLDDDSYVVVGIMPGRFENVPAPSAELWAPLQYDPALPPQGREWGHHLGLVGRLRPGIEREQAGRELDAISHDLVQEHPQEYAAAGLRVSALQDDVTAAVKPALLAIFGAVALLLAIACVNVMNLLLARGARRRGEFAMRAALGAGRARLIRQLLTESLLLAAAGGVVGLAVAAIGVRALVALSPPGLPRVAAIGVDGTAFAFALGLASLVGLASGLAPALHASRTGLHDGLQLGARGNAGGHLTRPALVVVEVALALVLLVGSGLLLRSLQRLFAISPGFDAAHLLTMQVQTSGHRFDDDAAIHRFFARSLDAVRAVPGVEAAAFTSQLPLSGDFDTYGVRFEPRHDAELRGGYSMFRYAVTPGYFDATGILLRRGRLLRTSDASDAPLAALINESFAARKFPGRDPIGRRVHIGPETGPWYTIVGVVGDVRQTSLALSQADAIYVTTAQWRFADGALWLVVRSSSNPASLAPAVERAVWSADKDQPIVRIATMGDLVLASAAERRFALVLFEAFGGAALALAAIGIYGVLSGSVTERLREIGVRSALGASPLSILALVLRQGMTLTGLGVLLGLVGAAAASRGMVALLFGVSRLDPVTYVGVMLLLVGVAGAACWLPAWRAARVDPSITLRAE